MWGSFFLYFPLCRASKFKYHGSKYSAVKSAPLMATHSATCSLLGRFLTWVCLSGTVARLEPSKCHTCKYASGSTRPCLVVAESVRFFITARMELAFKYES